MQYLIYGLIDPRDRLVHYVGESSSGMERPMEHRQPWTWEQDNARTRWLRDLIENNRLAFEVVILESVENPKGKPSFTCWWNRKLKPTALHEAERWWIAYGRATGWPLKNISAGGQGSPGWKPSEETRARMRAAKTPEACEAIRQRQLGRRQSPETIEKMRQTKLKQNFKHTAETKAKMSAAHKGRKQSPEFCELMRVLKTGTVHTPEARAKMSAAQIGRKLSASQRANISAGLFKTWAQRQTITCGTLPGYYRHLRLHEPTCAPCRAVANEYRMNLYHKARGNGSFAEWKAKSIIRCGTVDGYTLHTQNQEPICIDCQRAFTDAARRRERKKQRKQQR